MKPYYEKEEQGYLGWTEKALPAVANQRQEPEPTRPDRRLAELLRLQHEALARVLRWARGEKP